jgi:RNA polymerase sigma-70 factor (ECF subfamily)
VDLDRDFPDLVRAHQDAVFSIALRLTGRRADAEDAAQDAFVRAYRALRGYSAERRRELQVRPWLATITINVCRSRARSASRRPGEGDGRDVDAVAGGRTPVESAEDSETARELAAALRRLPDPQRRAVVLHHAGGLTYGEVATALGRPEGTVKADVHRGIAALRTILEPRELLA